MNAPSVRPRRPDVVRELRGPGQREPAAVPAGHVARRPSCWRRLPVDGRRAPTSPRSTAADGMPNGWIDNPLAFVSIADDGTVTIVCHRSEMGQGVRTGMPMIVADELEADWKRVRVAQAPGDEKKYGNQDTDGSRSTRHFFEPMRRCGAAARDDARIRGGQAAGSVPVSEVAAKNHEVVHKPSGKKLGYGALAKAAANEPVPARESLRLKDPKDFRYIGKGNLKLVDGPDIATGKAKYGIDTRLDGHALRGRRPAPGPRRQGGERGRFRGAEGARRGQGRPDRGEPGAAVLQSARRRGRDRAQHVGGHAGPPGAEDHVGRRTERQLRLDGLPGEPRGISPQARRRSCATTATSTRPRPSAAKRLEAEYYIPHLAHATMEPPAATARITNGKCEVWGCFQSPQAARDLVAKRLGISADDVTVHVTLLGGGFGRKSKPDYGIEAAVLSKAVDGKPVKVTWTRDDDLHNSLLPHGVGRASRGRRRRAGQAGGVAAPQRRADDHLDLQPRGQERGAPRARPWASSTCRSPFPTSASRTPRPSRTRASAGSGRSRTFPTPSRSSRSWPRWRRRRVGIRRTSCWRSSVRSRLVSPEPLGDTWNHGESPERYPVDTGRLKRVIETGGARVGLGPEAAEGERPWHRRALQLRELRRGRGGSRGRQQGR